MKVRELFENIDMEQLINYLISTHYLEKIISEHYKKEDIETIITKTIKNMLSLTDKEIKENENSYIFTIDLLDDLSDTVEEAEENKFFDVFFCDKNEMKQESFEHYALDFIHRDELLTFHVADICIDLYGEICVAGEIFWEITFYGYDELIVRKEEEKLLTSIKEIDKGKSFNNLSELFTFLNEPNIDNDLLKIDNYEDKLDNFLNISHEISKKNKEIKNNIFNEFLK